VVHQFRLKKPLIWVHYLASDKALKLEYDQEHNALRSGPKPEQPYNIEQSFFEIIFALYAYKRYAAARSLPAAKAEYAAYTLDCWQTTSYARFPFTKWFANNVPAHSIALQTEHQHIAKQAVLLVLGIGFFPIHEERKHPELIQIPPPQDD